MNNTIRTQDIQLDDLQKSLQSSFISNKLSANNYLMPTLLVNDYKQGKKIGDAITQELMTCESFDFSVAFINDSGLASLKMALEYLRTYNIKGRILTTNYLNFTSPNALKGILENFPNIELRAYTKGGFHPKGYIFKQSNYYSIIIGSANLTASALSMNQEWSIKFLSLTDGQIVYSVREEFENVWKNADVVTTQWLSDYKENYIQNKISLRNISKIKKDDFELLTEQINDDKKVRELISNEFSDKTESIEDEIVPNSMQKEAMFALNELRAKNEKRALLIAATGTGKTYLSIFDVRQTNPKRVLYVAHRDMILNKAENSFKTFLPNIKTGFLNGTQKDYKADYLFASIFTLAKDESLNQFKKDDFDYIIVDEVHHAGASSYTKIISYFEPKFLLGLTATPERSDGFDIFELFHNNIPYEIRLQKALEENLLCPFHYYGVSDLTLNGEPIDEKSDFTKLVCDERLNHIEHAIKLYRTYENSIKGLIFCSRVEEAKELSTKLNERGFYTTYLTGENSDSEREQTIQRLESNQDNLQYIISVDIFNEGVDIPCVNQVVMLRPTQSAIIFVQQLGRGLRKDKSKSFVSVIDFIGNYENNFFIPIALYGDNSYNKDNIRRNTFNGGSSLPGSSTIQFDEVAKQKIFNSINQTNFSQLKTLKNEYQKLKMRLARIPTMMDFINKEFIDPFLFIDYAGSYYNFKCKVEQTISDFTSKQICALQFVSIEFARGIRVHELLILSLLIENNSISLENFILELQKYDVKLTKKDLKGMIHLLHSDFYTQVDRKKYGALCYIEYDENTKTISRTKDFSELLQNEKFRMELNDVLSYGLKRVSLKPDEIRYDDNFVLYRKYSRKDVCKLLNWKSDCSSTVYGYKTETSYGEPVCPIFVTYNKSFGISETTKYDDVFIDNSRFSWMSRSRRTSQSAEVASIIAQKTNDIKVMLFMKKNDDEGSDFYYMGNMNYNSFEDTYMQNGDEKVNVVNIQFDMQTPIPQNLYNYFEAS